MNINPLLYNNKLYVLFKKKKNLLLFTVEANELRTYQNIDEDMW